MTQMETILSIMICTIVAFQAGREFEEWSYKNAEKQKFKRKNKT